MNKMRKWVMAGFFLMFFQVQCLAGDFIVEYVKENYRETRLPKSYDPVIYHSVQVTSEAGPKLLILRGSDYSYRKWVRQYISQGKQFIAQIPDDQDDLFISSYAFEMDVNNLHPFNLKRYRNAQEEYQKQGAALKLPPEYYEPGFPNAGAGQKNEEKTKDDNLKKKADLMQKEKEDRQKDKQAQKRISQQKEQQAQQKQQEQQKQLQALKLRQEQEAQRFQEELEQQKLEQQKRLAALEQQRELEQQRRREELEQRWLELKKRLLEDDRIRQMSQAERDQEMERRWLLLKARYGF
jgi:flagellar biosynthesis GTPase FlhF